MQVKIYTSLVIQVVHDMQANDYACLKQYPQLGQDHKDVPHLLGMRLPQIPQPPQPYTGAY